MKKIMIAALGVSLLSGTAVFAQNTSGSQSTETTTKTKTKHKKGKKETKSETDSSTTSNPK
jgi:hypothetical protein